MFDAAFVGVSIMFLLVLVTSAFKIKKLSDHAEYWRKKYTMAYNRIDLQEIEIASLKTAKEQVAKHCDYWRSKALAASVEPQKEGEDNHGI